MHVRFEAKFLAVSLLISTALLGHAGPAAGAGTVDTVVGTIATDAKPTAVAISTNGATAFVAFYLESKVEAIDIVTGAVAWTANVGTNPIALSVSPDGAWVYSVNNASSSVSRMSVTTGTVSTVALTRGHAWDSTISADGTMMYVANAEDGCFTRIDLTTAFIPGASPASYEQVIEVNAYADDVELSADGSLLYVAGQYTRFNYAVYRTSDLTNVGVVSLGTDGAICAEISKLTASRDGRFLYGTCLANDTLSKIFQVRLTDSTVQYFTVGTSARELVETPDGAKLYTGNGDSVFVSVLDVATGTVSEIPGAPNAISIALNPAGDRVFAATWGGSADNKFLAQIDTGVVPNAQLTDVNQTCAATLQTGTAPRLNALTSTATTRKGTAIYKSITPSTFLYWGRVVLPAGLPTTVTTQSVDAGSIVLQGTRGTVVYDPTCTAVKGARVTYGNDGSARVTVPVAGTYIVAVKYATTSLLNTARQSRTFTFHSTVGPWLSPTVRLD